MADYETDRKLWTEAQEILSGDTFRKVVALLTERNDLRDLLGRVLRNGIDCKDPRCGMGSRHDCIVKQITAALAEEKRDV